MTGQSQRPGLLTILCVTTFICSGLMLLFNSYTYLTADSFFKNRNKWIEKDRQEFSQMKPTDKDYESIKSNMAKLNDKGNEITPGKYKSKRLYLIISLIFCLIGAFFMFRVKKIGLFIYFIGTIISIAGPLMVYGFSSIIATLMIIGFSGVVFSVLYSLNYKHLK